MKKIVWGGFCLIAGILLFWTSSSMDLYMDTNIPEIILKLLAVAFSIYGLVLGFTGLRKD